MTDKAVSALTSLTGANTATGDLVYIVDISEAAAADRSKKITAEELQNYMKKFPATIGVGGATPAASGAGVSFPASVSGSSDANTLDDYEEGVWVPNDTSGDALTFTTAAGYYTKIGRLVVATFRVTYPSTASGSSARIGNLPFPSNNAASDQQHQGSGIRYTDLGTPITLANTLASSEFFLFNYSGAAVTNANMSTKTLDGMVVYVV
jgi:hypothetical protein